MEKLVNGRRCTKCFCKECGKEIWKRTSSLKLYSKTFCDTACHGKYKTKAIKVPCANPLCSKEIFRTPSALKSSKSGDSFCSKHCAITINNQRCRIGQNHPNWTGGSYRAEALTYYGEQCSVKDCDLTKAKIKIETKMLDVHHKDGDRHNNNIENLEVLCVWCHAKRTRNIIRSFESSRLS